jgi:ribosomal protein S18 acetylase RimI-like enzyme
MSELRVSLVGEGEQQRALDTLVLAFTADPVERWLYPEAGQYLASFSQFLAAFGGNAFDEGTAWRLGEFSAVAMWLPPGVEADGEAVAVVITETVAPERHQPLFSIAEQMDAAHPRYPHWYLPWLGVDPFAQGRGVGSELMEHGLRTVDADGLPAYLETPNPRTIPFYERHGFEVTGEASAEPVPADHVDAARRALIGPRGPRRTLQ